MWKTKQNTEPLSDHVDQSTKEEPRIDFYKSVRQTMKLAGMYPLAFPDHFPRILHGLLAVVDIMWEIFLYFVVLHVGVLYVVTLFKTDRRDFEFIIHCIMQMLIYFWITYMKVHYRRLRPKQFLALMDYVRLRYIPRSGDGFTYVKMDYCLTLANKRMEFYILSGYIGTLFWISVPFYSEGRTLPLQCWYPFDTTESYVYEILYFIHFIALVQVPTAFSSVSGFYFVSAMALLGQYDVLCCNLKNIVTSSYISMGASTEDLMNLRQIEFSANFEPNTYYCAKEILTPMEHLRRSTNSTRTKPGSFREAFRMALKRCIDHHRYIKEGLQTMEEFYNFLWLLKTVEVTIVLCLVTFIVVKSTTALSSFIQIFPLALYMLLVSGEMLIICYFAEIIFQYSQRCGDAIFKSPWYLHIGDIKNDLLLFLHLSQQSIVFTAGKITLLNIEKFRGVMTMTFSVFTLLQKMDLGF